MSVIISRNGKDAKRLNQSSFDKEDYLQQYIYNNPDAVPVYEIDEDIRLLILAREFGTASGPIDALGIDQWGTIYLIETKLYKNPDKRTVVAQVLDYGASLWSGSLDFTEFASEIERHTTKQFGQGLTELIQGFFHIDVDQAGVVIENIQVNLNSGTFKFVVLMDSLHRQLKDLILFINRNSRFDVYAVELEYYKHQEFEIIIPKLYGAEVKKEVAGTITSQRTWTLEEFWTALNNTSTSEQYAVIRPLIQSLIDRSTGYTLGKGTTTGSVGIRFRVIDDKSLITVYSNGTISINFGNIPHDTQKERLQVLGSQYLVELWKQPKFRREDLFNTYPSLSADDILDNNQGLRQLFDAFLSQRPHPLHQPQSHLRQ